MILSEPNILNYFTHVELNDGDSPEFPLDILASSNPIRCAYITEDRSFMAQQSQDYVCVPMFCGNYIDLEKLLWDFLLWVANIEEDKHRIKPSREYFIRRNGLQVVADDTVLICVHRNDRFGFLVANTSYVKLEEVHVNAAA